MNERSFIVNRHRRATTGSNRSALPQAKICCSYGPAGRRRLSDRPQAGGYNSYGNLFKILYRTLFPPRDVIQPAQVALATRSQRKDLASAAR